jgi:hypothetical protein
MPPDSTQNLNAKLSARRGGEQTRAGSITWKALASPIQSSAPPVRIVGAASSYRGGYRVER